MLKPQNQPEQDSNFGCYSSNSQNQQSETQIQLPLKSIDYHIVIDNCLASVEINQTYRNNTKQLLEIQYRFPINPNSCVYLFKATIGSIELIGKVKERQEAKQQYEKAYEEGRKVAYGSINSKSRDIMKVKIGNVEPQQIVKIDIRFAHEVDVYLNSLYCYKLPLAMTPRYQSSYEPQNKLKQYKSNKQLTKFARTKSQYEWSFEVKLYSSFPIVTAFTSTKIKGEIKDKYYEFNLKNKMHHIPKVDFNLYYSFQKFEQPIYSLTTSDTNSYACLSFIPKFFKQSLTDAEYHAKAEEKFQIMSELQHTKAEYIFLLDRSGSMQDERIEKAKEALIFFLKSLPEDCYFNIVSFGSKYQSMFKRSQKYENNMIKKAISKVEQMTANFGGTQIEKPLEKVLKSQQIKGYIKQIFLLTDGAVDNTNIVIRIVKENTKFARVNCIGIGDGCSQALIDGCAAKGKGYKTYITDKENPSQKIVKLLEQSLSPLITDIKLEYDKDLIESIIPNPQKIPYILKNELAIFYITFKSKLIKETKIKLSYQDSMNKKIFSKELTVKPTIYTGLPFIEKMIKYKKIRALEDHLNYEATSIQDHLYFVKNINMDQLKEEVIKQSIKHQIVSQYTSFICVDQTSPDTLNQQKMFEQKKLHYNQNKKYDVIFNFDEHEDSNSFDFQNECCVLNQDLSEDSQIQVHQEIVKPNNYHHSIPINTVKRMRIKETGKFVKKEEQIQKSNNLSSSDLNNVIKQQQINGSWINKSIAEQLYNKKITSSIFGTNYSLELIVTYLIVEYIKDKYPNQMQYKLILQKAQKFIYKNIHLADQREFKEQIRQFIKSK